MRSAATKPSLTAPEWHLIGVESLQWCSNNAVYFLGLIGAATYDLAGSAFLVAAVTLVRNLCTSLGNALAGPAIDRVGPRRVTLVTLWVSAVASLVIGLVPLTVASLVCAAVFLGLMGGFINTCTHAFPGYLVRDAQGRQRLNGLLVFYSNIAYTAGPIIGGVLVGWFGTMAVYPFMTVTMVLAALVAMGCREQFRPDEPDEQSGVVGSLIEGAKVTWVNPLLRVVFVTGFLGFFAFGAFDSLESLFYRDVLLVDIQWLGWLSAVSGAAMCVGAWVLTKLSTRVVNLSLLEGSLLLVGLGSMVYVGTDNVWIAALGQAITGVAWGLLEPVQMTLVQEGAPLDKLGRVMGFVRFGLMSAGVVPLLVAPLLAEALGVQPVLLGAATIIAAVGLVFWLRARRGGVEAREEA